MNSLLKQLFLILSGIFWVAMMALLWNSEIAGRGGIGSAVDPQLVFEKILTAPDDSTLEIMQDRVRLGNCRWQVNVGEELTVGKIWSEEAPEGMVKRLTGYTLDLAGNFAPPEGGTRVRFNTRALIDTNYQWQEFSLQVIMRPTVWEIKTDAKRQTLRLRYEEDGAKYEREFRFADLRNPAKLLGEFGLPALPLMGALGNLGATNQFNLGLQWEARQDWMNIGRAQVRVYRLETRFLERYAVTVLVSRVGEILRVDLPQNILLTNDALISF